MADGSQMARRPAPAAGVVLRAPDGRCLFLQRARGNFPYTWGLPGGHREPGEDSDETALRELDEECGYVNPVFTEPCPVLHQTENYVTHIMDVPQAFEPRLNDEHVDWQWAWPHMPPEPLHPALEAMISEVGADAMVADCSFTGAMDSDILAFDRGTVRRKDKDGRLHIELTNISKANICPYRGHEIPGWQELRLNADQVYNLLRDPEELAKGASTFNNLPLLSKHVPVNADAHRPDLVIGSVGTDAGFQAPYLRNSLVVWAADAIKAIELADEDPAHPDAMKELSSAYYYKADMTPGTAADGTRYDGVMREIVGNHVALVKDGRAGDDVVVGDSAMPKAAADDQNRDSDGKFGSGGGKTWADVSPENQRAIREMVANKDSAFSGDPSKATPAEIHDMLQELRELDGEDQAMDTKDANGQEHDASGKFGSGGGGKTLGPGEKSKTGLVSSPTDRSIDEPGSKNPKSVGRNLSHAESKEVDRLVKIRKKRGLTPEEGARLSKLTDSTGAADRTAMDSKETTMSKTVLTRKGALLQGAVHAFLLPMLAQDAQIDLTPALRGVGPKNYKARKPTIATAVGKAVEGKLAQDATLDGLLGLLDAMDDVMPMEPVDDAEPDFLADKEGAMDDDPSQKVLDFLKDKISSDDCAAVRSMLAPPSAQDEDEDDKKAPAEDEDDDESKPPAEDEDEDEDGAPAEDEEDDKEMVTKAAMDSAISAATKTATANALAQQRALRDAEAAVRPWVGDIVAQDSADGVYRTALKALNVDVTGVHPSALPAILKAQPLPSTRDRRQPIAMDAAGAKSFAERYPDATRIATA